MSGTMEIDRRNRRRYDTQLATTYQLDHVRRDRGYRAVVVATRDGHMLAGSMGEPMARDLASYTSMVGIADEDAGERLIRTFAEEHLEGSDDTLHVHPFDLGGVPVFLGIVAAHDEDVDDAAEHMISGVQRIFAAT